MRALLVSSGFLATLGALAVFAVLPPTVFVAYLTLSIVTIAAYALDKSAARRGSRRIPESTLHVIALAGGWPGAMYAQQALHHKTVKRSFRRVFRATIVGNCLLLTVFLLARGGSFPG